MRRRRNNRGFTLAELIVAATLLSVAMTAIYGLLYSAIGAWRQLDQGFDPTHEARLALTLLQRDIESASIRAEYLMEGDSDTVTLFTVAQPMNVADSEGERLMRVRYRYQRAKHELVREEAMVTAALPNRPEPNKKINAEHVELSDKAEFTIARNIQDFELRYIWVPAPVITDVKVPPPAVDPIYMQRHKENWGLPTGMELRITLHDPVMDQEQEFRLVISFPLRRERLSVKQLNDLLGSAA